MNQSLKQLYAVMLMSCGWVQRHEILLDNNGWVEEHTIETTEQGYYSFEIKFVIDMVNGYIEIMGVVLKKPGTDHYPFIESQF